MSTPFDEVVRGMSGEVETLVDEPLDMFVADLVSDASVDVSSSFSSADFVETLFSFSAVFKLPLQGMRFHFCNS